MLRQRLYYSLKPYLPWRLRIAMRRIAAAWKRGAHRKNWPISETAGRIPPGWNGWPDQKKFALVLTHDVEGPAGLSKCRQLAELEMELGFRSSFNFIPEGSYSVPPELRAWLTDNGFEVGVHDLKHDGKLYQSLSGFEQKATRINHHLKTWGASGFRSGFMLRNLEWIHKLNVTYDSSTFDTDPFEPQSNGSDTIFPYWIPAPNAVSIRAEGHKPSGYVELPYTLPQDSTLFLVLREKTPEIWLRKTNWIAQHGGMALVNVHPDYVRFLGEPASSSTYTIDHYRKLLLHIRANYDGQYWSALPRQVAEMTQKLEPRPELPRARRIGMITHSFYETDNRVTRYAEALSERGDVVEVLALRRGPESPKEENLGGVRVSRIQYRIRKSEQTKFAYAWPMIRFLVSSSWILTRRHAKLPYDVLHIHNMPDFLVFAAWYPKLVGVKIILDIHDIVPELYASKFGGREPAIMPLLKLMERLSASFSDHVIVSNHLWLTKYTGRTGTAARSSVFINNVDTRVYHPQRTRNDARQIILFPGGLQWHQGLDIALRAFSKVAREIPTAVFHIYGDGNMKQSLIALTEELQLQDKVTFFDPVPITTIVKIMANADLGVVPKRADSFGNQAYSTKIMEFMSLGVPVVVSKTEIDRYYFDDSVVRFFESGNSDALAQGMIDVLQDHDLRTRMVANASAYAQKHGWNSRKADYLRIVDSLSPALD
jgi:glycosyltransferase involved in cell wall biosynthesis